MVSVESRTEHETIDDIAIPVSISDRSYFRYLVILLCVLINAVDGYDILVMSFAAPALSKAWSLSGSQLGLLFSASLFGILIGAVMLAPWADRFGRRPVIILSLLLVSSAMALSAVAPSFSVLLGLRSITGAGVGGLLSCTAILVAEYAPRRYRGSFISLLGAGYSVGGMAGGLAAGWLLENLGWPSTFFCGAALSFLMLCLVIIFVPESIEFLLVRQPVGALEKINRILRDMKYSEIAGLPKQTSQKAKRKVAIAQLLDHDQRVKTILIWCAFLLHLMGLYFLLSWTPKLLAQSEETRVIAIQAGTALNVGGLIGSFLFSVISPWFNLRKLTALLISVAAASSVGFAYALNDAAIVPAMAVFAGTWTFAGIAGLYSLVVTVYPAETRGLGMGCAVGVGRLGSMLSPFLAGVLLDAGMTGANLYMIFAVPFVLAAVAVLMLRASGMPATAAQVTAAA